MSVSQSSSSSEDQSILASLRPISSMLSTRRRLQCTLTMFLTVAQASLLRFFVCIKVHHSSSQKTRLNVLSYGI